MIKAYVRPSLLFRYGRVLCATLTVFFLLQTTLWARQGIPLVTGEWAPYTTNKVTGKGVIIEMLDAVFDELNIDVEYHFFPWRRAEKMILKGAAYAAFPYIKTMERSEKFDFSDRIMTSTGRLFYLVRRFPWGLSINNYQQLAQYQVGGVLGYWYEDLFKKHGIRVFYVANDTQNFKTLNNSQIDMIICDELVGWHIIRQLYPAREKQFATVEKPINTDELRLMVSRTYPGARAITRQFNKAMEKLRKQGRIKAILERHGVKYFDSVSPISAAQPNGPGS